eukprot:TRINITY_DN40930_c0_g1_i1.p2 TRINITY_DN40930_c0_g1~~TRINITY_DN40930_c0_g1_i1.p2  ORF type:complete len:123 (+),score=37.74 TRINITY_DN40930_c0_g1_i1:42-371(+)
MKVSALEEWGPEAVVEWLKGVGLGHLSEVMMKNEIDGGMLLELTRDDIKDELCIEVLADRKALLQALDTLKTQYNECRPARPADILASTKGGTEYGLVLPEGKQKRAQA